MNRFILVILVALTSPVNALELAKGEVYGIEGGWLRVDGSFQNPVHGLIYHVTMTKGCGQTVSTNVAEQVVISLVGELLATGKNSRISYVGIDPETQGFHTSVEDALSRVCEGPGRVSIDYDCTCCDTKARNEVEAQAGTDKYREKPPEPE